jgi:hypothetical protein
MPPAVIEPNSIRGEQIVADVNVRRAVAVKIAEHHRQSPIIRRKNQWLARFIQKSATRPRDRLELSVTIVEVKYIRFASLANYVIGRINQVAVGQFG